MRTLRWVFAALTVLTAVVVQTSFFALLPLPGPSPSVVLVVVASFALLRGPEVGMITGFAGGLLLDLAPPADHALGRLALAYLIVGYVIGKLQREGRRSAFVPMIVIGVASLLGALLDLGLGGLFGYIDVSAHDVVATVPLGVIYDVVLAPFVFPVIAFLDRRLVPYRGEVL